jgi:aspartyl-tRNA(Asn)/glutamyl-tRNA(Gln) amidotransferase subunit A
MAALHELSAVELGPLYGNGELSPVEVARSVIEQVQAQEPRLHALWAFDADAMISMARESEARWRSGQARGPLDGVPVTIKENIATRGLAVPLGSAATVLTPAAADAPPAARLREAGCVFVAKTTMPDLGMLTSGLSSFHALARNPWDTRLNPGGSSAGAGAACAAGYGPLHIGTDIGGSIRLPASWCGVVGFKPSLGRVPIHPPYIGRVAGPMTRTVADAALAMATLSRPDARDTMSLPWQDIAWGDIDGASDRAPGRQGSNPLHGLRVGLWLDAGWGLPLHPEIEAAVTAAARRFEAAGATVEPLPAFTTPEVAMGIDRFWRMRAWIDIAALPPERRAKMLPYVVQWAEGAAGCSAADLFRAFSQIGVLRDAAVAATRPFDCVLAPVSPVHSFPAEHASPTHDPATTMDHIGYTLPFNMSEQPAISVPCSMSAQRGTSAGGLHKPMPIGLQIVGARHDDIGVLRIARVWEQLRDPLPPWPV